ncbi:MAG: hypothetical protein WAN50_04480 [Minisyncoccia bacterium]
MADIVSLLVLCQALGAAAGVFLAIRGEIAYVQAMRDGKIDRAERAHLDLLANGLRFGMTAILFSSLCLVILSYAASFVPQPALSTSYWFLITLALIVTLVSWALSRNRISFAFGSAIIFTGWWFLTYLNFGLLPGLSFGPLFAFFVVAVAVFYGLLQTLRYFALHRG